MEFVDAFGIVLLVGAGLLLFVVLRLLLLRHRGAQLDLALRRPGSGRGGRHWHAGVGRMRSDCLQWWRLFGVGIRPGFSLSRTSLRVLSRRAPHGGEAIALSGGSMVLCCELAGAAMAGGVPVELALAESLLPAVMAWLESAPPGASLPQRVY